MNIYDGCISNKDTFYRDYNITWDEQLDNMKLYYEKQGYKVIFVFLANPFQDAARVVLYNKDSKIPEWMRNYRHKYVRFNGHWYLESQLGICDKCGEYTSLTCLCKDGLICDNCSETEEAE